MVGPPPLGDPVLGKGAKALLGELLEQRLVVLAVAAGDHVPDLFGEDPLDEPLDDMQPGVHEAGADQRFQRVRQQGALAASAGPLLSTAQKQVAVQGELPGDLRQALLAHDDRLHTCQVPFGFPVQPPVQPPADHQAQHGVAQELQPLVAGHARFGGMGTVAERKVQQALVAETDADAALQGTQLEPPGGRHRSEIGVRSGAPRPKTMGAGTKARNAPLTTQDLEGASECRHELAAHQPEAAINPVERCVGERGAPHPPRGIPRPREAT